MTEERARYLLAIYLRKEASPQEKEELFRWIQDDPGQATLTRVISGVYADFTPEETIDSQRTEQMLSHILSHDTARPAPSIGRRWMAAAAILLIAGPLAWYYSTSTRHTPSQTPAVAATRTTTPDVPPGTTRATLTLDNGSVVVLDTVSGATIASQGNTRIVKKDGRVVYQDDASQSTALLYNTLSTARGHQYPLTLSDGTKVWLNAASSIRFPVLFSDKERSVEVTGEAYFEVQKNIRPFIVNAGGTKVEVLGTHFNVNAYTDEQQLKTTLLEGAVKVSHGTSTLLLAPGQQAQVKPNAAMHLEKDADTEEAISWTQNYFHFNDASVETILRQLSRWYDVDIVYKKQPSGETFNGDIQKSLSLLQVLKILDRSQVRFQIDGRRLIVL